MNPEFNLYLGLDTSAYTTSLALIDQNEKLIVDKRMQLKVQKGRLGLRQSEAVFAHVANIPRLLEDQEDLFKRFSLKAVAFSVRPRPLKSSYMPVFKVGEAFGLFIAQTMGLLYWPSSHQEGHILAGLWSADLGQGRYLVIHLSGGTTELLTAQEISPGSLTVKLLGGSADLNAGQFIDRIGQAMGFDFPAGKNIEQQATKCIDESLKLPLAVSGSKISFSGPASHAERLLNKGCSKAGLARAVENCIADSICEAIINLKLQHDHYDGLLLVGGVTANKYIRLRIEQKLHLWKVYCGEAEYAGDNAVGLAVQAARYFRANQAEKEQL